MLDTPTELKLCFDSRKDERRSQWLLRQFGSEENLVIPSSTSEDMELHRERGLDKQYRDGFRMTFFPTDKG